nr:hypothetical protein [Armatimonadota bacterium]
METPLNPPDENPNVFVPAFDRFNRPSLIVTLGRYYGQADVMAARGRLASQVQEERGGYRTATDARREDEAVRWSRCINELNKGRKWPLKRLTERLRAMLSPDVAIAVVPSHDPVRFVTPVRTLAQALATEGRTDATGCLVRHTHIQRIVLGGQSTRALHRQTITVENPELVTGRSVLLLDDVAKSGASLLACRDLLMEAGAGRIQCLALGRVTP